jgi:hypothetical protein
VKLVYVDAYRAIRARAVLRENGISSALTAEVQPGTVDPDAPHVFLVEVFDAHAKNAADILNVYDLMGSVLSE